MQVAIIGAGAAGIAAATKLIAKGFEVKILEAEERIGGRIRTVSFSEGKIDLGAQWCHGEKDNVVYEVCSKYPGIFGSTGDVYASFILIRSNKEVVSAEITTRLTTLISDILEAAKFDLCDSKDSFGCYLTQEFHKYLDKSEYKDIERTIANEFFEFYKKFECSVDASDSLNDLSGRGYNEYWECKGDPVLNWKDKGYISFLHILMKSSGINDLGLLKDKIFFKKKVSKICWLCEEEEKIKITCDDLEIIEADHIIFTPSLGVLKENHKMLFEPSLPDEKIQAIESLGFGTVNKIYIEFEKKFWPDNWPGFSILWEEKEIEFIRKRTDSWIEDLFGFYTDYQNRVLCGWISGQKARNMEKCSDDEVLESCRFLLIKFLSWHVPQIISIKRSNWFNNSNFRGSYSYQSIASEVSNSKPKDLAKPISAGDGTPIIQFAGEATHDHYFSTVHGAVESGWREADRLIKHYSGVNRFNVLILGGGLAGLGAAYALKNTKSKYKVGILEGQNYIGGRVLTSNLTEKDVEENAERVDMGAQWLHGEENLLFKIAEKYDLIEKEQSEEGVGDFYEETGEVIEKSLVNEIDILVKNILNECEKFKNLRKYPDSVEDFLQERFIKEIYKSSIKDDPQKINQALKLLNWHRNFQIIDNSSIDLKTVSAKAWGLYSSDGEKCQAHFNIKNGFSSLIKAIIKEIQHSTIILLNKTVKKIDWKYRNNPWIGIETSDNEFFYANHVIVTFSLGVLKKMTKLFDPELAPFYRKAIDDMGFETINKIYIQFEYPWWGERKGIQFAWDIYDSNSKNNIPAKWTRHLTGFDVLKPGPKNTLVGWIGSHGAKEIENLKDEEIVDCCIEVLKMFTKRKVPQPKSYLCSRWGKNPYVRGGYSFISTKCDKNEHCRDVLDTTIYMSVPPSSLILAGEAYHKNYFSTAHGAFLSGFEKAKTIHPDVFRLRRTSL